VLSFRVILTCTAFFWSSSRFIQHLSGTQRDPQAAVDHVVQQDRRRGILLFVNAHYTVLMRSRHCFCSASLLSFCCSFNDLSPDFASLPATSAVGNRSDSAPPRALKPLKVHLLCAQSQSVRLGTAATLRRARASSALSYKKRCGDFSC